MNLLYKIDFRASVLVLLSCVFSLLLLEIVSRWFIVPSNSSYGTLFGHELPPLKIVEDSAVPPPPTDLSQPYDDLIIEGKRITLGDLNGFHREDPLLGYTNEENALSMNGWWQTNNLGARCRSDVAWSVPSGMSRMLIFGESFALGSRVPQEKVWSEILRRKRPDLEVMNFAVDGYSMAQAFLRYTEVKDDLEHDLVALMFVPDADLWRDINMIRNLADDWDLPYVMPRFALEKGKLQLIRNPYPTRTEFFARNVPELDPELRTYLRRYDRFYVDCVYGEPGIFSRSIIYKLGCKAYYTYYAIPHLRNHLMDNDGEAVQVFRGLANRMEIEVEHQDARFIVIFLPNHIQSFRENHLLVQKWKNLVTLVCSSGLTCIDLLEDFMGVPETDLDKGYDGTHYGPKANRLIAELVAQYMERKGVLKGL
jgi:hypothetical protein